MKLLLLFITFLSSLLHAQEVGYKSRHYWDAFYAKPPIDIESPSPFALEVLPLINKDSCLLELGCGNGRDASYFAKQNIRVYACDVCHEAIERLKSESSNPLFFAADFTNLGSRLDNIKIGTIYSRFTFHSITKIESKRVIEWAYEHLQPNGLFLIEARSIHDPLYGKGELVEKDAYVTDHYRRFIKLEDLIADLKNGGFLIQSAEESRGFAPYNGEDPPIIRVVAKRNY